MNAPVRHNGIAPTRSGAEPRQFSAHVHRSLAAVESLWRRFERDGTCTAFQCYDWVVRVVRHLGVGMTPLIVEIRDQRSGAPLLLAPLLLRRRRGCLVLEWLSRGVCDYSAPLLAPEARFSGAEAQLIWEAVLAAIPGIDLIDIDGIPHEVAGSANPFALIEPAATSPESACGLAIEGDPETLLERICIGSFLRDLRLKQRRLAKAGDARFIVPKTADEAESLFDTLLEQRRERFQRLGRFDLLNDSAVAAFYRDAVRHGVQGGPMRICGLRLGEDWLGVAAVMIHAGTLHGCLLSIGDGRWHRTSPGLQLIARIMRWSCAQGHGYFDFSVGAHGYKSSIGAQSQPLFRIVQARTVRGAAVAWAGRRVAAGRAWLKSHPAGYGALRRLRRRLRAALGQ